MQKPLLSIRHGLVKNGSFTLAVPTMDVHEGEMVALIGRNGVGKSSLIEGIFGFTESMSGEVNLFGNGPFHAGWSKSWKKRIGLQLQKINYSHNMKVSEIVRLHDVLYCACDTALFMALGLKQLQNKVYRHLSRGEKQRADLYMALGHPSDLLVLDEPSTGLDHHFEATFHQILEDLRRTRPHCAILMASHDGEEVAMADRIAWLQDGTLKRMSSSEEILKSELGDIKIELKGPPHAVDTLISCLGSDDSEVKRTFRPKKDLVQLYGARALEGMVCQLPITAQFASSRVTELVFDDLLCLITEGNHDC